MLSLRRAMLTGLLTVMVVYICVGRVDGGEVPESDFEKVLRIRKEGPYFGIMMPNSFEMNPLIQSPSFEPDHNLPYFDFAGKRFRIGSLESTRVIIVMTKGNIRLQMLYADITTTLLITLFAVKGVIHYGIAGNANSAFQIGDVTIPLDWAYTGLFNEQSYGDEPDDYAENIGYMKNDTRTKNEKLLGTFLNPAWYQPEELFPANGTPEAENASWVRVNETYFSLSKKLEDMELEGCVNATTCLPRTAVVRRVQRGVSANMFVNNIAYRQFLHTKFNVTPIDMESAAVALKCRDLNTPFIAIRALSDLSGWPSSVLNETNMFASLAAQNAVAVAISFVKLLSL